jgi:hypothetical protein
MKCPICRHEYSEETLQDHHLIPLQYNGPEDGQQAKLCSNCHLKCHYTAENLTAKAAKRRCFFNSVELERARPYIQMIINAKILARNTVNSNARGQIIIQLDHKRRNLLHRLKTMSGHKSINSYLIALIDQEIRKLTG